MHVTEYPDGTLAFRIDVAPTPASRPRVTKQGWTYYGKRYKDFRAAVSEWAKEWEYPPLRGPLEVETWLYVQRPKTTERQWPRGDNDNYEKAVWDCLNGIVWEDDDQIVDNRTRKRFTHTDPCIIIIVRPVETFDE